MHTPVPPNLHRPAPAAAQDKQSLILHQQDRLYRLALLVTGTPAAAGERLAAAFAGLAPVTRDPELELARALLHTPKGRNRPARRAWQPDPAALERAGLSAAQAAALLTALAAASPAARLQLGLHTLLGLPAETIAVPAEALPDPAPPPPSDPQAIAGATPNGTAPDSIDALIELRCTLALALGYLPVTTERPLLLQVARLLAGRAHGPEAVQTRGLLLTSADARALRDGLFQTEATLQQAIPALFAATPPPALTARLLKEVAGGQRSLSALQRRPRLLLVGGVLLLLLLLVMPEVQRFAPEPVQPAVGAAPAIAPAALIDAAIHRFERNAPATGLLHEVYQAQLGGERWTLERWYDYSAPHRLKVIAAREGEAMPLYALATDGQGQIQYRWQGRAMSGREQSIGIDVTVTADEIAQLMPILRQQPEVSIFQTSSRPFDIGPFYLAQARNADLTALGATDIDGRAAQMVTYRTTRPFPPLDLAANQPESAPTQVILAIDTETYALLDVTIVAQSAGESVTQNPWRATSVAVQASVPLGLFALEPAESQATQTGLASVRLPTLPAEALLSLDAALATTQRTIYLPEQLPAADMRGLAANTGNGHVGLLYEGAFHTLLLYHNPELSQAQLPEGQERTVNGLRYWLPSANSMPAHLSYSIALVTLPDDPDVPLMIQFVAQYATPEERIALLEAVIGSLQPLTAENLNMLGRNFYQPVSRGASGWSFEMQAAPAEPVTAQRSDSPTAGQEGRALYIVDANGDARLFSVDRRMGHIVRLYGAGVRGRIFVVDFGFQRWLAPVWALS